MIGNWSPQEELFYQEVTGLAYFGFKRIITAYNEGRVLNKTRENNLITRDNNTEDCDGVKCLVHDTGDID